jgi:putative salt-induced outer membrane protein
MRKITAILLAAGALLAADLKVGEFKQHVELGYLGTSGNSDSKTLSALYGNDYQWTESTDMHFKTDAYYGEKDGDKTDERYRAYGIVNHHYSPKWYSYAEAGALRNTFEGYEQQYNGGLGMGYVILDDKTQLLKVRGGYQFRWANFTDGTDDDFHYLKLGANYNYFFGENNTLESELNFLEDLEEADDYEAVFRIGVKVLMVESLSLRVGFEVKYDNTPPLNDDGSEKEKTDTTTTVGIVYDF